MKMPFDIDKAIEKSIDTMYHLQDFYRTYTGPHLASIKIEDKYFICTDTGLVTLEYNDEGREPLYQDYTYTKDVCDIRNCDKTYNEIRDLIRTFFYEIPPDTTP
jgi:hypothetical protein